MVFDFVPLTYDHNYVYPGWAQGIGVCMGLVSMICIPVALFYTMYKAEGTLKEVRIHVLYTIYHDPGVMIGHMWVSCEPLCILIYIKKQYTTKKR